MYLCFDSCAWIFIFQQTYFSLILAYCNTSDLIQIMPKFDATRNSSLILKPTIAYLFPKMKEDIVTYIKDPE